MCRWQGRVNVKPQKPLDNTSLLTVNHYEKTVQLKKTKNYSLFNDIDISHL